jgi:hypothetical protein
MTAKTNKASNAEQQATALDIHDIVSARNVIQIASKRGAFTDPAEYQEIGKLFNKLDAFIKGVEAQVAEQKEAAEASTDSIESTEEV